MIHKIIILHNSMKHRMSISVKAEVEIGLDLLSSVHKVVELISSLYEFIVYYFVHTS